MMIRPMDESNGFCLSVCLSVCLLFAKWVDTNFTNWLRSFIHSNQDSNPLETDSLNLFDYLSSIISIANVSISSIIRYLMKSISHWSATSFIMQSIRALRVIELIRAAAAAAAAVGNDQR